MRGALDVIATRTAIERLPRLPFVDVEPPIHEARGLAGRVGIRRILIKRDDLIGVAMGGNKVRGLEYLLAEAVALGSDTVVTGAGPQSNHVRATALLGRMLGMDVVAVLWGRAPASALGNLRLTEFAGARVVWTGSDDRTSVDEGIAAMADELRRRGRRPYVIPRGGASPLAVIAHVQAAQQVHDQLAALGGAQVDRVVLAAGSGATAAGWLLWRTVTAASPVITAVSVSRAVEEVEHQIVTLAASAASRLGLRIDEAGLRAGMDVRDAVGPGYGIPSPEGTAALRLLADTEAILLDPTYTAKALAGWLDITRSDDAERNRAILFVHTGGLPALFADPT